MPAKLRSIYTYIAKRPGLAIAFALGAVANHFVSGNHSARLSNGMSIALWGVIAFMLVTSLWFFYRMRQLRQLLKSSIERERAKNIKQ